MKMRRQTIEVKLKVNSEVQIGTRNLEFGFGLVIDLQRIFMVMMGQIFIPYPN